MNERSEVYSHKDKYSNHRRQESAGSDNLVVY